MVLFDCDCSDPSPSRLKPRLRSGSPPPSRTDAAAAKSAATGGTAKSAGAAPSRTDAAAAKSAAAGSTKAGALLGNSSLTTTSKTSARSSVPRRRPVPLLRQALTALSAREAKTLPKDTDKLSNIAFRRDGSQNACTDSRESDVFTQKDKRWKSARAGVARRFSGSDDCSNMRGILSDGRSRTPPVADAVANRPHRGESSHRLQVTNSHLLGSSQVLL